MSPTVRRWAFASASLLVVVVAGLASLLCAPPVEPPSSTDKPGSPQVATAERSERSQTPRVPRGTEPPNPTDTRVARGAAGRTARRFVRGFVQYQRGQMDG